MASSPDKSQLQKCKRDLIYAQKGDLKDLVLKRGLFTSGFLRIYTTNVNLGQYFKAHLKSFEHLQVGGEGPAPIRPISFWGLK